MNQLSLTADYFMDIAEKLYVLDSTTISLFKAILKPTGRKRMDGKSKAGIKVHALLKADNNMPCFIKFTAAALHDQQFYECIKELPNHSITTFDNTADRLKRHNNAESLSIKTGLP